MSHVLSWANYWDYFVQHLSSSHILVVRTLVIVTLTIKATTAYLREKLSYSILPRDVICLHCSIICNDGNSVIFWKYNSVARILYNCCMRHYFTIKEVNVHLLHTKFFVYLKMYNMCILSTLVWLWWWIQINETCQWMPLQCLYFSSRIFW